MTNLAFAVRIIRLLLRGLCRHHDFLHPPPPHSQQTDRKTHTHTHTHPHHLLVLADAVVCRPGGESSVIVNAEDANMGAVFSQPVLNTASRCRHLSASAVESEVR